MIILLIKYCSMIFCNLYLYAKLLNIRLNKNIYRLLIIFLPFELLAVYLIRKYAAPFSIFFIVTLLSFLISKLLITPLSLSLTVSSISFGIVYSAFLIAALLISPIGCFFDFYLDKTISDTISMICIGITQFSLITLLFKIKRLKKGMTFLKEKKFSDVGAYISLLILLTASFLTNQEKATPILIIPLFFTFLLVILLFFWWRNSLTKRYLNKLKDIEIKELHKIIEEKNMQIEKLKYHNDKLSKIIHQDNKLIPSLEYAVKKYILLAENAQSHTELATQGNEILVQLESVSQERKGILINYELKHKKLTLTKILSVDTLLSYMFQKANKYHIDFNISLSGSMRYLIDHIIPESDLRTLLADLIDNSIITTKIALTKNILINIGLSGNSYSIDIYDSGEQFHEKILLNLGKKQTTTHKNEGGSGIGLMSTFDIINRSHASFIIKELEDNSLFNKKVSICFDNLKQIRIITTRTGIKNLLSKRADIIVISEHKMDHDGRV